MRLEPESSSLGRWLAAPVVVTAVAALLLARRGAHLIDLLPPCRFRDLTGAACPTCGGTHAAVELAWGRPLGALDANPAVPAAAVALALWGLWAAAAGVWPALRVRPRLGPRETRAARWGAALLLLALWARQALVL
ncbi:MAG: DUF2752 domain-containing protein [Candidatus Krumholzibacteriia bacterium]